MPQTPASSSGDSLPELRALGERLSQSRRRLGLSQEELADRLRLGTDQLDALETGDLQRLPEPVFVIAQAKRVAGALGISIEDQINAIRGSALMAQARRSSPAPAAVVPPEGAEAGENAAPPAATGGRLRLIAAAIAAVLALSGTLLLSRRSADAPPGPRLSPPPAAPVSPPAPRP